MSNNNINKSDTFKAVTTGQVFTLIRKDKDILTFQYTHTFQTNIKDAERQLRFGSWKKLESKS
ncbi:hypothetical protein [Adhaeribacter aquaticus]|uniref:hypothetical protein n=1 Tax=Adhaeribacter aquaticus TaxID=299567 RepID=UPI0003FE2B8E|nr:hypothetical protein [Adhaeribacter aquaticus]